MEVKSIQSAFLTQNEPNCTKRITQHLDQPHVVRIWERSWRKEVNCGDNKQFLESKEIFITNSSWNSQESQASHMCRLFKSNRWRIYKKSLEDLFICLWFVQATAGSIFVKAYFRRVSEASLWHLSQIHCMCCSISWVKAMTPVFQFYCFNPHGCRIKLESVTQTYPEDLLKSLLSPNKAKRAPVFLSLMISQLFSRCCGDLAKFVALHFFFNSVISFFLHPSFCSRMWWTTI